METKIDATVAVLTRNSASSLGRALESVKDFSEIIVCDGYSIDETRAIAQSFGAIVIDQDPAFLDTQGRIIDYAGVRNQTLDRSTRDAFLFLDSDEYVDDALVTAVRHAVESNAAGAYWVNRKYVRVGVVLEYATTYPNKQMRFFFRSTAKRFIKKIHERIELNVGVEPKNLDGVLYVPFDMSLSDLRKKWRYQADVEVLRIGALSISLYSKALFEYTKVSLLYAFRYMRILFLFQRPRMPFLFEMERHMQHLRLARRLWRIVKIQ